MQKANHAPIDQTSSRELLVDLRDVARGQWGAALVHSLRTLRGVSAGCGADMCEPLWEAQVGTITSAPSVSDGQLYVSTPAAAFGLP